MKLTFSVLLILLSIITMGQQRSISDVEVIRNTLDPSSHLRKSPARRLTFTPSDTLKTPNPSPEAIALYRYLQDMFGKQMLSGQMWAPWGINEIDYVVSKTGKKPAVAGFDYINEYENAGENQKAIDYWKEGGITTIMWHWGAPGVGEGYENSKATIDIDRCFIEGTDEYLDFWSDLERIGDWLQILEDENIPVLWRPFHELNGGWFWWSKEGPEPFKLLWKTMFDYLVTERGLNNLIWVLCYTGDPDGDWFPGAEYVDIAGADTYDNLTDSHVSMYNDVLGSIDGNNYPITFHENGNPPDAEACIVDEAMWSWWMTWHTDWLTQIDQQYLTDQYESHLVITHDELPDIVSEYSWDASCIPSTITAFTRVDNEDWNEVNKVNQHAGTLLSVRVETEDEGSWNWRGYGLSNTPDNSQTDQTVTIAGKGTLFATFTNNCGAKTTQTFHLTDGNKIVPLQVDHGADRFILYPNPVSDLLNLKLQSTEVFGFLRIYNLKGQLVLQEPLKSDRMTIRVSMLPSGTYQVILPGVHAARFIKK